MNKTLDIALAKLRYSKNLKEWHANLGYSEVIELYKDGYRSRNEYYDYVKDELKKGRNSTVNMYYYRLGKNKPKFMFPLQKEND